MVETTELDTTQEKASPNGRQALDNAALLQHILSKKPEEKLISVPEWGVELLCKTLDAKGRLAVEGKAYNKEDKTTDYRRVLEYVVIYGCFNPDTKEPFFKEEHAEFLRASGGPTAILAITILQLSHMVDGEAENTKKN